MKEKHMVIPIFIPHKGCPFDCIYCNQKAISGQMFEVTEEEIRTTIENHIKTAKADTKIEIGFYGGSFTGIETELQIKYLKIADEYFKSNSITGVRLSTRPDYINETILNYLKKYNVNTIELGVQSLDSEVLSKSCRGHSVNDVIMSSRLIKQYGISLGIQTMIGLPADTKEKALATANRVIELKPDVVRIYPTLVVKNTFLERMYFEGSYKPLELDEAIDLCSELLELYEANEINVIRVGLQATDRISEGNDIVAGPFHPAFRQLVESRLALRQIVTQIKEKGINPDDDLIIYTSTGNISNLIGQKRFNVEFLKSKFGIRTIKIIEEECIKQSIIVEKRVK